MNHYFCLLRPTRPDMHQTVTPEEAGVFEEHCHYLHGLFGEKKVLQAGTSFEAGEEGFAIVILEASTKTEAVEMMQKDPAVARGLLSAKVTEYRIFLDRGMPAL